MLIFMLNSDISSLLDKYLELWIIDKKKIIPLFHCIRQCMRLCSCFGNQIENQLKPVNSMEYARRSSRSGSLVNTPDHQAKASTIPTGTLFSLDDDAGESSYLEARNDSSASNSTCSFDAPPDVLPPVPPRITNPPPRNNRVATSDHLIIIDTDDQIDTAPVPAARRAKTATQSPPPPPPPHTKALLNNRIGFENNFVQNTNSLNLKKNNTVVNRSESLIEPPPKPPPLPPQHHKLIKTNETKPSEVCRISSHLFFSHLYICRKKKQKKNHMLIYCFCRLFVCHCDGHCKILKRIYLPDLLYPSPFLPKMVSVHF